MNHIENGMVLRDEDAGDGSFFQTCDRCGEIIPASDSCGKYGCVHCYYDGLTYNIGERQSYIASVCGVYDSRKDMDDEYDKIWAVDKNEPESEKSRTA